MQTYRSFRSILGCSLSVTSAAGLLLAAFAAPGVYASPPTDYNLVWSDEFNGSVGSFPNSANWVYDTGFGWGSGEQETYTTTNATVQSDTGATDGKALRIQATKSGTTYSSSRIKTLGLKSWTYGYYECRAKVPPGGASYQGYWPAFWTMGTDINTNGWPACGESDIMEHLDGTEPNISHTGTIHGPSGSGAYGYGFSYNNGSDLGNAYHLYAELWQPNSITFYVDGIATGTVTPSTLAAGETWEFNKPNFLLLNMAIGGSWPGNITGSTVFPANFMIDYVRVYQAATNYLANPGFETGSLSSWTVWSPNGTGGAAVAEATSHAISHSGNWHATEWYGSAYNVDISQTPTSLPTGTYTLTAWVRSSGGQSSATMYVKKYSNLNGTDAIAVNIPTTSSYVQVTIPNISLTTGQAECGFYSIASANQWINVDDVSLTKN